MLKWLEKSVQKSYSTILLVLGIWGTLGTVVYSSPCFAQSATPSATPVAVSRFNAICGTILANAKTNTPQNPQALQYCQAASDAKSAAESEDALWKVWTAVSVVCLSSCIASFAGFGNQFICTGMNISAGISEAVITKNFMEGITVVGVAGMGYLMNNSLNPEKEVVTKAGQKAASKNPLRTSTRDYGACMSAAQSAFMAISSSNSSKAQYVTVQGNLASALAVAAQAAAATAAVVSSTGDSNNANASSTSSGGSLATGGNNNNGITPTSTKNNVCTGTGNAGLTVQCALASNSNIPRFVGTPRFANDFNKASGMNLGDFFSKSREPGKAILAAVSNGLNASDTARVGAALKKMEQDISLETSGTYSHRGGGGGGRRSASSGDDGLSEIMAGMAGMMNAGKGKEEAGPGVSKIAFANQSKQAAEIAEDTTLSIFDRITYRYFFVGRKFLEEGEFK